MHGSVNRDTCTYPCNHLPDQDAGCPCRSEFPQTPVQGAPPRHPPHPCFLPHLPVLAHLKVGRGHGPGCQSPGESSWLTRLLGTGTGTVTGACASPVLRGTAESRESWLFSPLAREDAGLKCGRGGLDMNLNMSSVTLRKSFHLRGPQFSPSQNEGAIWIRYSLPLL